MSQGYPPNRRRAERVPMPPAGGVISVVGGRLLDVSPYGMKIESPLPIPSDSVLEFRLVVAEANADVEARVASCTPAGTHRYGVGLEFTRIAPEVQDRIRQALADAQAHP